MASPYAQSRGGGGSAYAQSRGGGGSAYSRSRAPSGGGTVTAAPSHGGGSLLGRFLGDLYHGAINSPAGAAHLLMTLQPATPAYYALTGQQKKVDENQRQAMGLIKALATQPAHDVAHPLRHPGYTFLDVLGVADPALSGVSRVGAAARVAGEAGTAGDIAKALATRPVPAPRILTAGRLTVHPETPRTFVGAAVKSGIDTTLQTAAGIKPTGRVTSIIQRTGEARLNTRVSKILEAQARIRAQTAQGPAQALIKLGSRLTDGEQKALQVVAEQVPLEKRITTTSARITGAKTDLARSRHQEELDLLHEAKPSLVTDASGKPALATPRLQNVYDKMATVARDRETLLKHLGVLSDEAIQNRTTQAGRVAAGAEYVNPTPGLLGVPSQVLIRARANVARLEGAHARAQAVAQRFKFTAADAKRVGENVAYPTNESVNLRARLRPLEKELRAATEQWNAPAKVPGSSAGRMTEAEAHDRLAYLDAKYEERLAKLKPEVNPYATGREGPYLATGARESEAGTIAGETRSRNTARGRLAKGMQPYVRGVAQEGRMGGGPARIQTIEQELRDLAEAKLHQTIADNPEHPVMQAIGRSIEERDQLRQLLNDRAEAGMSGERPPELPLKGEAGPSIYEQRSGLNRIVRSGTVAQHALGQFTEAAGAASEAVPGLEELQGRVDELTNAINEARGFPPEDLLALRKQVAEVRAALRAAEAPRSYRVGGEQPRALTPQGELVKPRGAIKAERLSTALSVARDRLQQLEASRLRRMGPSGIVGQEDFTAGRDAIRIPDKPTRKGVQALTRAPGLAGGGTIGHLELPGTVTHQFTGVLREQGLRRQDTTTLVGESALEASKYAGLKHLHSLIREGVSPGPTRMDDIAVRLDDMAPSATMPLEVRKYLTDPADFYGQNGAHEAATAFDKVKARLFMDPKTLDPEHAAEFQRLAEQGKIGWVPRRLLGDMAKPTAPLTSVAGKAPVRLVDAINNASRFSILYLKPAYAIPNLLGNAALNILQQGFASVPNLVRASRLNAVLGEELTARIDAAMGEGVSRAISAHGEGRFSGSVDWAARKWSTLVDTPFRRSSFIYEARRAGYHTPQELEQLLTDPAKVDELDKISLTANREIIDYSNLSPREREIIRRVIFFYPWVKGSTTYAGRLLLEHPTKAAILGNLGQEGQQFSHQTLGNIPSYLEGSFGAGGGLVNPSAAAVLQTPAQVAGTLQGLATGNITKATSAASQLTPAAVLALAELQRRDPQSGIGYPGGTNAGTIAQKVLTSNLPQVVLVKNILASLEGKQGTSKLYPPNLRADILRFLVGNIVPRPYNKSELARLYSQEQSQIKTGR